MFILKCRNNFIEERKYIFHVILNEILGLEYKIEFMSEVTGNIVIECADKAVILADVFFNQLDDIYKTKASLPMQPLQKYTVRNKQVGAVLCDTVLPVIYGKDFGGGEYYREIDDNEVGIGIDIFGSAFFMLARYEEVVKAVRDAYDRFPAHESLAYQEGFLERPIINEYIELLWLAIHRLWPDKQRKQRNFCVMPTHDVDRPFGTAFLTPYQKVHTLVGDLLKRRNLKLFLRRAKMICSMAVHGYTADEDNTFDTIMTISEANALRSTFFFMTAQNESDYDGNYDIFRQEIVDLIKTINARGHRVGIHPSFSSYNSKEVLGRDVSLLRSCLEKLGISHADMGGRQHYLRWKNPETWRNYDDSDLKYDASLSYADHIGFRCGICYEYTVYDIETRKMLRLKEYPLIVMECSGLDKEYMNLTHEEMFKRAVTLKRHCEKYKGNFVILWHNSRFIEQSECELYRKIIEG